jgi:leader peptidase (prepilin peptidase)/N-methyltransferase
MIEALVALVFGLLIGSFLNVCIYRWPRDLSVVRPRSHCPACEKTIAWYDNVPLVSFLILRRRCRHCGARISWRYPQVELLTALLFFYFVWQFGPSLAAAKMCVFSALLVGLIYSDLEELILPDEMTLGGIAAGLVFAIFVPIRDGIVELFLPGRAGWITEAALAAALPAFFLWFAGWVYYRLRQREGLGLGDVKLVAMIGSFLGLSSTLMALAGGSIAGSIIGYSYIKITGKDPSTYELPFGTFLGAAALVVALASQFVQA